MNILLVVHRFWPELAGTEVYTLNLARQLAARHQVWVYFRDHREQAPGFRATDGQIAGVSVRRVSLNGTPQVRGLAGRVGGRYWRFVASYRNPAIERDFEATLERLRPDVVHVQHLMYLSARLIELARRQRIPVIVTLNDFWFKCNNAVLLRADGSICADKEHFRACADCASGGRRRPAPMRWLLARLLEARDRQLRQALRSAQCVISPSRFLRDEYAREGYLAAEAVRVIEYGIDTRGALAHQARAAGEPVRFAYVGSLAPHKGVHILIEAFNGVQGAARLDIYGSLEANPEYAARLQSAISHPQAKLRGALERQQLWPVLSQTDALIVPSIWYENSPVIIQEARAARVPVIGSALGGIAEKVQDGVNGRLFAAGDSQALRSVLQAVVDAPEQLEHWRAHLPPASDIADHARRLEEVYREVLEKRSG